MIVTQTLPPGTKGSRQIDGIWVTDFAHACDLVTVVREMVIMIHGYETRLGSFGAHCGGACGPRGRGCLVVARLGQPSVPYVDMPVG